MMILPFSIAEFLLAFISLCPGLEDLSGINGLSSMHTEQLPSHPNWSFKRDMRIGITLMPCSGSFAYQQMTHPCDCLSSYHQESTGVQKMRLMDWSPEDKTWNGEIYKCTIRFITLETDPSSHIVARWPTKKSVIILPANKFVMCTRPPAPPNATLYTFVFLLF